MTLQKYKHQAGQGMTEYLIIVALIAISSIAIVRSTSTSVKVGFGKVSNALQGNTYSGAQAEAVTENKTNGKSMSDFNDGALAQH